MLKYILACHLQIDPDPVLADPAHNFDVDRDPDFYSMRIWMRIQVTKIIRIRIHNTAEYN